jgi:hypothetical protein
VRVSLLRASKICYFIALFFRNCNFI